MNLDKYMAEGLKRKLPEEFQQESDLTEKKAPETTPRDEFDELAAKIEGESNQASETTEVKEPLIEPPMQAATEAEPEESLVYGEGEKGPQVAANNLAALSMKKLPPGTRLDSFRSRVVQGIEQGADRGADFAAMASAAEDMHKAAREEAGHDLM